MIYKVLKKQNNSAMCFVCGIHNKSGLNTSYYELENNQLIGVFKGQDVHQSYPERMHGGIVTALLDETIGRAVQTIDENIWGVTVEITVRFVKPVPLDQVLYTVGYATNIRSRMFEGEGYVCNTDKEILATAKAKYFIQHVDKIVSDIDFVREQWIYVDDEKESLVKSFDLPR
jgi:acyl-coenzyme A thioesterase PaaI-like protein